MSGPYQAILEQARRLEEETISSLMALLRTPSFSTKEENVIRLIQKEMEAGPFDEVRIDGLGNVIGRMGSGPRVLAFDAHVDTVYPGEESLWDFDPFEPKVENGRIWGRGASDQKAGMASMLAAARIIGALDLNKEFTLFFTGTVMEEDCDGLCWQYLIKEEKIRPDLVVITEPTSLNLHRGQRGRMEIKVNVTGRSSHGSAPERGDNAVYKISRVVLEVEKLNEALHSDSFLGKGSVAVTEVTSASPSLCAVPDGAGIHLDRRLTEGETMESAIAEVREALDRAGCPEAAVAVPEYDEPAFTGLVYPTEKYYPTWVLPEDSPWLEAGGQAFRQLFNKEPLVDKWTFSTNGVAIAGMHGIPCLGFGPGEEPQAHAPNESCPVSHLKDAAAFYAALVAQLNGKS